MPKLDLQEWDVMEEHNVLRSKVEPPSSKNVYSVSLKTQLFHKIVLLFFWASRFMLVWIRRMESFLLDGS